jgi:hypothetical protein
MCEWASLYVCVTLFSGIVQAHHMLASEGDLHLSHRLSFRLTHRFPGFFSFTFAVNGREGERKKEGEKNKTKHSYYFG